MLPIRDHNPGRTTPIVTWAIIAVTVYVYFMVQPNGLFGGDGSDLATAEFLYAEATIPCEVVTGEPLSLDEINSGTCTRSGAPLFPDKNIWWSVVVALFFHGSLFHLFGNMWMLWIFGDNVEDDLGHVRYASFYIVAGLVASAAHILSNATSTIPVVGASGAIAGVMGAYLVLHAGARVTAIILPFFFFPFRVPAALFLVLWFVGQFSIAAGSNIAWEAHVGGFVAGVVYALAVRRRVRGRRRPPPDPWDRRAPLEP